MPLLRFIPETTNVDFVGWRWYAFGADGLLMVLSIVAMLYQGFNLGIDFTGGVRVEAKAAHTITEAELGTIRAELAGLRFGEFKTIGNLFGGKGGHAVSFEELRRCTGK